MTENHLKNKMITISIILISDQFRGKNISMMNQDDVEFERQTWLKLVTKGDYKVG